MAKSLLKHVSLLQNCVSMSYGSMCLVSMCLISRKYLSSCPYWGLPTLANINVKYSAMLTANICLDQLIGCDCIWYDWEHINYDYNQGDQTKRLTPVVWRRVTSSHCTVVSLHNNMCSISSRQLSIVWSSHQPIITYSSSMTYYHAYLNSIR